MLTKRTSQPKLPTFSSPIDNRKLWWWKNWNVVSETETTFILRCDVGFIKTVGKKKEIRYFNNMEMEFPIIEKQQLLGFLVQRFAADYNKK